MEDTPTRPRIRRWTENWSKAKRQSYLGEQEGAKRRIDLADDFPPLLKIAFYLSALIVFIGVVWSIQGKPEETKVEDPNSAIPPQAHYSE